ncbi:FMN-dependent NADH-azoreductase [Agrobacterium tumefaciens]|uniref:FMN-dependent NADH-azoreductase n=1 Tax=Agrobacterium tumefaciens TaxID=358 RepID=UPI000FAD632C|nr:NAD(P)H-dependent oxidoreductase [Agrobacterium tumefaciens]NSX94026.1 NAD(P)H-dependent oxidoreductase [Agrobacterium tumefaciens]
MKVFHVNASPRGTISTSLETAEHFLAQLGTAKPIQIDRLNLFSGELPEFGETAAAAKMALFSGAEMSVPQAKAWADVRSVYERLEAADLLVISTPLWNNGTPYALKQFIDIVTQPGWSFGFNPSTGYAPLLTGRKAVLIQASGVYYENIQSGFGSDFNMPYLMDWLDFIGIELAGRIDFSPTVLNMDVNTTKAETLAKAEALALAVAHNGERAHEVTG